MWLIHHLYQHSGLFHNTAFGSVLQVFGYLSVACFFFLSGYGLYASLQIKGTAYTDTFVKRKVVPYYKVLCIFVGIYFLFRITQGTQTSIWEIFKSLTFGGTIIGNGWYLQVQLVLYLLFYVVFGLIHQKKLVVMVSTCISFCICLYLIGYEATWYEGIMAFPLEMVWCAYHDRLFFLREKRKSFIVTCTVFLGVCVCFVLSRIIPNYTISVLCKSLSAVIFPISVMSIINWIPIQNKVTRLLGKYSMEIYVLQGIFLSLFHNVPMNITNPYVYVLCVTVSVFAGAMIVHPAVEKIYIKARKR